MIIGKIESWTKGLLMPLRQIPIRIWTEPFVCTLCSLRVIPTTILVEYPVELTNTD